MTLRELGIGESALILSVGGEGALRQHFLDMGVIPGAEVTVIKSKRSRKMNARQALNIRGWAKAESSILKGQEILFRRELSSLLRS